MKTDELTTEEKLFAAQADDEACKGLTIDTASSLALLKARIATAARGETSIPRPRQGERTGSGLLAVSAARLISVFAAAAAVSLVLFPGAIQGPKSGPSPDAFPTPSQQLQSASASTPTWVEMSERPPSYGGLLLDNSANGPALSTYFGGINDAETPTVANAYEGQSKRVPRVVRYKISTNSVTVPVRSLAAPDGQVVGRLRNNALVWVDCQIDTVITTNDLSDPTAAWLRIRWLHFWQPGRLSGFINAAAATPVDNGSTVPRCESPTLPTAQWSAYGRPMSVRSHTSGLINAWTDDGRRE